MARTAEGTKGVVDDEASTCRGSTPSNVVENIDPRRVTFSPRRPQLPPAAARGLQANSPNKEQTEANNGNRKRPPPQDSETNNNQSTNKNNKKKKKASWASTLSTQQQSTKGKAILVVEKVLKVTHAHGGDGISPVGRDDAIFLAEKMMKCQEEFKAANKPSHVCVGFHYTKSINMNSIREKGILCSASGFFGPGIYSANNFEAFCGWGGGNVGVLVAVLKGSQVASTHVPTPARQNPQLATAEADTVVGNKERHLDPTNTYFDEIVLQRDCQVLPLIKFDANRILNDSIFQDLIWTLHQQIQHNVLDMCFNDKIQTNVTRIEAPAPYDPLMPGLVQPMPPAMMPQQQTAGNFSGTGMVLGGESGVSRLVAGPDWSSDDDVLPEPAWSACFDVSSAVPDAASTFSSSATSTALPEAVLSSSSSSQYTTAAALPEVVPSLDGSKPDPAWSSAPVGPAASSYSSAGILPDGVLSFGGAQPEPALSSVAAALPVPDAASSHSNALPRDGGFSCGGANMDVPAHGSAAQSMPMLVSGGIVPASHSVRDTGGNCTYEAPPLPLLSAAQLTKIEACIHYEEGSSNGSLYDIPPGKSPSGTMTVTINNKISCAGLDDYGSIFIKYELKAGVQISHHPNPGINYNGTKKYAYLPNIESAQELLKRLKWAFSRGLTFTVGTGVSADLHLENRVLFTIPHKTALRGGKERKGWPDKEYFFMCNRELDKLRVPSHNRL